ncbi:hypothetical protein HZS_2112 [Henneguya salminicola]|nr:hypothetical protein HZS_2112 [Henneguya salminicola]
MRLIKILYKIHRIKLSLIFLVLKNKSAQTYELKFELMDAKEHTLQPSKSNISLDCIKNNNEIYQKFGSSIYEIKQIILGRNNVLEYVIEENSNPCNLILTENFSQDAVSTPNCTTGNLTKSSSFLSYIAMNPNSELKLAKVIHLESREYATIKSVDALIISISLNDQNLLAILYDSFLLNIYQLSFSDNKVRLNFTWNNPGHLSNSIVIWTKDSVRTYDVGILDHVHGIFNERVIESFNDVLTACMSSNSLSIAIASGNNIVGCHRANPDSEFENYFSIIEDIIGEQIISIKLLQKESTACAPSTLIVLWSSHVLFYNLFALQDKTHMYVY